MSPVMARGAGFQTGLTCPPAALGDSYTPFGSSEIIELLHAEAHFSDDGPQGAFGNLTWMAGHRDGDVFFGELVNRVTAGPDLDVAGPAQFASQFTMRDRNQLRH